MQERFNSIANALELRLSCNNPLIWNITFGHPDMLWLVFVIMIDADALARKRHQSISNHHVDSTLIILKKLCSRFRSRGQPWASFLALVSLPPLCQLLITGLYISNASWSKIMKHWCHRALKAFSAPNQLTMVHPSYSPPPIAICPANCQQLQAPCSSH